MDPTTITVTINSVSTELNLLSNLLAMFPILLLLLFSAFIIFTLFAISTLKGEKSGIQSQTQAQQIQQQDSNVQQSNNKGISIDYRTLNIIKGSFAFGITLAILIIVMGLLALGFAVNNMGYAVALAIILGFAISMIPILSDGYSQVKKLLPKRIKRIVKKTIIYEDGTTVEKEKKYEY